MRHAWIYRTLLLSAFCAFSLQASRPVPRTLTGCVQKGVLYTVYPGKGSQKPTVYRISVQKTDLAPYEGKKITVKGKLLPGDRFYPEPGTLQVLGPCDADSRTAIHEHTKK